MILHYKESLKTAAFRVVAWLECLSRSTQFSNVFWIKTRRREVPAPFRGVLPLPIPALCTASVALRNPANDDQHHHHHHGHYHYHYHYGDGRRDQWNERLGGHADYCD